MKNTKKHLTKKHFHTRVQDIFSILVCNIVLGNKDLKDFECTDTLL